MFEFKKFPSLENHYQVKLVQLAEDLGFTAEPYLVTEKVHGANFSFHTNGTELQCAKRTGFIEQNEKFFNYRPIVEKYREGLFALGKALKANVIVYGELYGGNIQAGMPYKNEQDFVAFDLVVNGTPINKILALTLLTDYGIPTVPVVGVYPSLDEAMALNESFTSKLLSHTFAGDAAHAEAEGLVIEPTEPKWYPNGSRVYFKKKTKRFLEKGGNKVPKPTEKLPEELEAILLQSLEYITKPRFESVASKVGEVSIKDIGKLTGLMTQDILVDMEKDELEVPEHKQFMKLLQGQVQNFIRPILLTL